MSTLLGSKAYVALGTTKIGNVTSHNPTINFETQDQRQHGEDYMKPVVTGRSMTVGIEGHLNPENSQQAEFHTAALDSTSIDPMDVCTFSEELRIYESASNYWTVDTASDTDAHWVLTAYSWTSDASGLIAFSATLSSYGPITRIEG